MVIALHFSVMFCDERKKLRMDECKFMQVRREVLLSEVFGVKHGKVTVVRGTFL